MQNTENKSIPLKRKRRKKRKNFGFLYLFAFVFLIAFAGLSYVVKSFSPDVDVAIGNNDALTLSEGEMDVEIKSIDERLKWIQMEDEMPSVALRETDNDKKETKDKDKEKNKNKDKKTKEKDEKKVVIPPPPPPSIADMQIQRPDFRSISPAVPSVPVVQTPNIVIPEPKPTLTKVYLGSFSSLEEAILMQNKVSKDETSIIPFIKATNNSYIVQLGSFSEKEKADALIIKLREKGYSPKVSIQ